MKTFKELLCDESSIYEMATLGPKDHEFGVDVKMNILQPGDKKLPHGPRAKFLKKGIPNTFSISINEDINKIELIGDYYDLITTKEFNILLSAIKKYRIPLLNFWHDPDMSVDELKDEIDQIDRGFKVEKSY